MSPLIASDLDRTLIYSSAWIGDYPDPVCVEHYKDAPQSYMTPAAARDLTSLPTFVPVTTRTFEQYSRVDLGVSPQYAVTTNGGTIVVDGKPDPVWRAEVDDVVAKLSASLAMVSAELDRQISDEFVRTRRIAEDLFVYIVMHTAEAPDGFVEQWKQWCEERGWTVSQQGRKIYSLPSGLCKSTALAEVRRRLGVEDEPFFAAGDGILDREMLLAADAAIRPRHGELEDLGWTHPDVAVTSAAGVRAGEEIVEWFRSQSGLLVAEPS